MRHHQQYPRKQQTNKINLNDQDTYTSLEEDQVCWIMMNQYSIIDSLFSFQQIYPIERIHWLII